MKKTILTLIMALVAVMTNAQTNGFSGYTVADEGAWCWFADPRALHYENESGTINATYIGYIDVHGSIKATQVDFNTGRTNEVLIRSWFQPDDHDNPSFLVLPDERIMIIYSRHTDEACFYYRISKRPGDITQLGDEKKLVTNHNTTYPNPFILSDDPEHIYMCWRGINWHPTVAQMSMPDENDNIKYTWGPYQMVQSTGARPYAKYISDGKSNIYLAYTTGHPDNEQPNWLYLNAFSINDKSLYDIRGNKLKAVAGGAFNVSKTDTYKNQYPNTVVDQNASSRDWLWNMAFNSEGKPVVAMTRINSAKTSHDYYYAYWNGSKWNATFLTNGGGQFHQTPGVEMCYSGGMAIDRDNPTDVYCSVPVNGVYEIVKYKVSEDGSTLLTGKEQITSGSKKNNVRPFVIEGTKDSKKGAADMRLTWMNGDYYYWIVSNAYPKGYPTAIMASAALPLNMTAAKGMSASIDLSISHSNYGGKLLTVNGIEYGLDASTRKPYIIVNGQRYNSQNVLGTADSWKTHSGTTDGTWPSISLLNRWNLTLTYDEETKRLTAYRNGIIDQQIECELTGEAALEVNEQNVTLHGSKTYKEALSQDAVKAIVAAGEMEAITVPEQAVTDIVLPTVTSNNKEITWTSSNEDVLSKTGLVNLPKTATTVKLTARVGEETKEFKVTVLPRDILNNIRAAFSFDGAEKGITLKGKAKITDGKLDLTTNTATGFSTNGYAIIDEGLLKDLRSYTVLLTVNAKSLTKAPRLYDLGAASGNSLFLRANALSAGIKLNGGTTTMVNASATLAVNKEYKLAVTFDAATKQTTIYIDGEVNAAGTANQNEPYMIYEGAGDARNYIGRTQWWDTNVAADNVDFVGTIDDIRIYDIALTKKEICQNQGIEMQEKEYAKELANPDFEGTYKAMAGSGVASDRAIYVPEGWSVDYGVRNENDFNALKNGDLLYSQFFASKTQNAKGGKQTMWIRQRWGDSDIRFYQELKPEAGKYTLTADIFCSDMANSYVYINKVQKKVSAANRWETVSYDFETDGEEVIEIGLRTIHGGSEAERICAFDNFVLTCTESTGIKEIMSAKPSSELYDIMGRKVAKATKGIYIKNGKKYVK